MVINNIYKTIETNEGNGLKKGEMLLHFEKCKCLHTGHGDLDVNYKMGDTVLSTTVKDKDLGVRVSANMGVYE